MVTYQLFHPTYINWIAFPHILSRILKIWYGAISSLVFAPLSPRTQFKAIDASYMMVGAMANPTQLCDIIWLSDVLGCLVFQVCLLHLLMTKIEENHLICRCNNISEIFYNDFQL